MLGRFMRTPVAEEIDAFYRAGLEGLRYLEAREGRGRRFGEAAQAAWQALGGEFEGRDRLDLLLRDAAAVHPLAFAPRAVFEMSWLPDDEPFGAEWPGARAAVAEGLLREGKTKGTDDQTELLLTAAKRWSLPMPKVTPGLSDLAGRITPASRVLLAGPSAMLALVRATNGRRDVDLAEQVVVLSANTAERQLWGLALVGASVRTRPRVVGLSQASAASIRELGVSHLDFALVAEDAPADVAATSKAILSELGG